MIDDDNPTLIGASVVQEVPDTRGIVAGVFLAVIDPAAFGDPAHYAAQTAEHLAAAKRVPPAADTAEVLIPGEPEVRARAQCERDGITLPEATWHDLATVGNRFGVPLPESRSI